MTTSGPTVVVVGAGYEGERRYYQRLAGLGARLAIVGVANVVDDVEPTCSAVPGLDATSVRMPSPAMGSLTFWARH